MPRILWLCALACLLANEQNTLQAQETWQLQHILDNDDYVLGVQQSPRYDDAPRDNRGLALSHDHRFLYLGYNNPSHKRLVRKISLHVKDPANNRLAVVAQLDLPTASSPAKAIATDDRGRVYLARGRVLEIYDTDLGERLYTLSGFEKCEGVAVARLQGKLVLYASDRGRGTLTRFEFSEGEGTALLQAWQSGWNGEGRIAIAKSRSLRGLAVHSDGTVWLADHEPGKVFRVYADGRAVSTNVPSAMDVALDEKRGEVFVTQDTLRSIAVLRLADGALLRTITPPFADLQLSQEHAGIALSGVESIPGQALFVSNETGRSITLGAQKDSPFSDTDDDNIVFGDDNDPVLVMKFPFAVDAGPDREIAPGQAATLGGNPTVSGGLPPFRYRWTPLEGLNDNTLSNPIARPSRTVTYNLIVTDKAGNTAQDQVTITAPAYVFLARNFVFFAGNENSVGNIYANGPITFERGLPGIHRGDLTAGGEIILYEQNLIIGDIKTRGKVALRGNAKVDGAKREGVEVAQVVLPQFSFQTGGANVTLTTESALPPGSYGKVRIASNVAVHLQNGEYFFERLTAQTSARIVIENASAPTHIHVTAALALGDNAKVQLAQVEGASTTQVHFKVLQKGNLEIGKGAVLLGNLLAPEAHVSFASGARLVGSVAAEAITIAKNASFYFHPDSPKQLFELAPVYLSGEAAPVKATGRQARSQPRVEVDTVAVEIPVVVDSVRDTAQIALPEDTLVFEEPKSPQSSMLVPILAGLILLGLLALLLFLLIRRKRATQALDYWQVQQTRRSTENSGENPDPSNTPKGHWRIRSRR